MLSPLMVVVMTCHVIDVFLWGFSNTFKSQFSCMKVVNFYANDKENGAPDTGDAKDWPK